MRTRTHYYHIRFFDKFFKEYKDKGDRFQRVKTTYTKKLIGKRHTLFFNDRGKKDDRVLSMINSVRKDGLDFINNGKHIIEDKDFDYFKLIGVPPTDQLIAKVDIKGAYWKYAVNQGIVKKETDEKLTRLFDGEPYDVIREARQKILGCLATKKVITTFEKGKIVEEDVIAEPTTDLYIDINRGIDKLMCQCAGEVSGCFYYYWDCMFMKEKFVPEAVEFFKMRNLDVRVNTTKIDFVPLKGSGYLIAQNDDKMYFVRKEDRRFINHLM